MVCQLRDLAPTPPESLHLSLHVYPSRVFRSPPPISDWGPAHGHTWYRRQRHNLLTLPVHLHLCFFYFWRNGHHSNSIVELRIEKRKALRVRDTVCYFRSVHLLRFTVFIDFSITIQCSLDVRIDFNRRYFHFLHLSVLPVREIQWSYYSKPRLLSESRLFISDFANLS